MYSRLLSFLICAVYFQCFAVAQDIRYKDLRNSAWQLVTPPDMHMAGPMVMEFTDSTMSKSMYFKGSNGTLLLGRYDYYLSDTDDRQFNKKKLGKKSDGKYLIYKSSVSDTSRPTPSSHQASDIISDVLFMEDDNTLRITKGNMMVDRYTRLHPDTLKSYKAMAQANLNEAVSMLQAAMNMKTIALDVPGQFYHMMQAGEIDLKKNEGLRLLGPLRSCDVWQLRKMLIGDDAEYPNIKILDLSRAWIVTDTLTFGTVWQDYTHEQFMNIRGNHYDGKLSDFISGQYLDEVIDPNTMVHAIRHGYGTTIELPAMPRAKNKRYHQPTYIKFLSTTAGCIPEFMLEGMQHVEIILLPQFTREIRYGAFKNCKKISHVTIPPYVTRIDDKAFEGCAKNFSSEQAPKIDPPMHNVLVDTLTNDSLRMAYRTMSTLSQEYRNLDKMLRRQTDADSIKAYRARIEAKKLEMQRKMVYYVLVQADPTVAPILISSFRNDVDAIHSFLFIAKDAIAFSPHCSGLWTDLFKDTDMRQLEITYNDPKKMFHITTSAPGTLWKQLSEDQWNNITQLRITGPLNDKDLQSLFSIRKHLYSLDLTEAAIEHIPERTFSGFYLRYVALPRSLKTIGTNAFSPNAQLTEVVFGDSIREINANAFYGCDIQSLSLPSSLRRIGRSAFANNTNLREVTFPEGIDTISVGVLERCTKLESVKLPASARFIGNDLTRQCPSAVIEIHPDNPNYTVVEGSLVGKDDRTKVFLNQKELKKPQGIPSPAPKAMPTRGKYPQAPPMGVPVIMHYKMVNGKKVLDSWEVKK